MMDNNVEETAKAVRMAEKIRKVKMLVHERLLTLQNGDNKCVYPGNCIEYANLLKANDVLNAIENISESDKLYRYLVTRL